MNIIKSTAIFFILFLMFGCGGKEDIAPPCETNATATITISNTLSDPYDLYVDNVFKSTIPSKQILKDYVLKEGNGTKILLRQKSGYIFFPTEYISTLNIVRCSNYTKTIP